jgi:hypothetical protein
MSHYTYHVERLVVVWIIGLAMIKELHASIQMENGQIGDIYAAELTYVGPINCPKAIEVL